MTTNSLDDQLAAAWVETSAHAENGGAPNHEALMRRVRSRRRRTYAVRGTATAVACLALTGGGVAIASTLKGQGFAPATSPSESSSTPPTTGASAPPPAADPPTGKPVTLLVTRVIALHLEEDRAMPGLDSAVLVHFSADRSRVEVVPLSKFAEVDASGCALDPSTPSVAPLSLVQAFNAGTASDDVAAGLRCVITSVTATTGVAIDGYTVTDFTGFVDSVDAFGGIEVCVPEALAAPRADLDLSAGWQRLDGSHALGLARTREADAGGDATDNAHSSREGRVYAALLKAALASPKGAVGAGDGSGLLNDLLSEVRAHDAWTVQAVEAPEVVPLDAVVAPWDGNAYAVFDALAADRAGVGDSASCQ